MCAGRLACGQLALAASLAAPLSATAAALAVVARSLATACADVAPWHVLAERILPGCSLPTGGLVSPRLGSNLDKGVLPWWESGQAGISCQRKAIHQLADAVAGVWAIGVGRGSGRSRPGDPCCEGGRVVHEQRGCLAGGQKAKVGATLEGTRHTVLKQVRSSHRLDSLQFDVECALMERWTVRRCQHGLNRLCAAPRFQSNNAAVTNRLTSW